MKAKRKQIRQKDHPIKKRAKVSRTSKQLHILSPPTNTANNDVACYPPPFPREEKHPLPEDEFLKFEGPYKQSFRRAIETAYEGFVTDQYSDGENTLFDHESIQQALLKLDDLGIFRTDVTQPFGLGTKCAKTYVARCLIGDEGTTYKYLGLRMFAHPWKSSNQKSSDSNLDVALQEIFKLNERLTGRTEFHLRELEKKRNKRLKAQSGMKAINGRAMFDITLINRMVDTPELKMEPTKHKDRCSVSWHADSSLEHYSTIAVYQTFVPNEENKQSVAEEAQTNKGRMLQCEHEMAKKWSIALRVAHNSEGPGASRRGTDIDTAVVVDTPAISVSLPSRSAYYLLDDFNHHHQHAVLVNSKGNQNSAGVRYASTHRLLREGHNVNFMIERCKTTCSHFHRKGAKLWKSEQLLLYDIECDWIRQFYVQGQGHKHNLWRYWSTPICELLRYWGQLESRTKQVIDLLSNAAIARCEKGEKSAGEEIVSRADRKKRDKRKKALNAILELMKRGSDVDTGTDVLKSIYEPISEQLELRATMRSQWHERENDRVFHSMSDCYKPIPLPFYFDGDVPNSKTDEAGISPLVGAPDSLMRLASILRKYGNAFVSGDASDLPDIDNQIFNQRKENIPNQNVENSSVNAYSKNDHRKIEEELQSMKEEKKPSDVSERVALESNISLVQCNVNPSKYITGSKHCWPSFSLSDHQKDMNWKGWKSLSVGLEMQEPWAGLLLRGKKKIETRAYDLPKFLFGRKIDILQTKHGKDGISSLPNVMAIDEVVDKVERIGWCIFDRVIIYRYKAKFEADEPKHLVKSDSAYGWKHDTKVVYGWVVAKCGTYKKGENIDGDTLLVRRMRSLFEINNVKNKVK